MDDIVNRHRTELVELCREFGVDQLEVFGSAATGRFDPARSDIDLLVTYPSDYEFGPWLTRYFDLRDRLVELLGCPVDLVIAREFDNPYFARAVQESRRLVYAA